MMAMRNLLQRIALLVFNQVKIKARKSEGVFLDILKAKKYFRIDI